MNKWILKYCSSVPGLPRVWGELKDLSFNHAIRIGRVLGKRGKLIGAILSK